MAKRKPKIKSDWKWKGETFELTDEFKDYYGFIYLIEDLKNQKKYIGEKSFWSFKVPEGKVNRKKLESDWQYYVSSNKVLKSLIKESGEDKNKDFRFTILSICKDKAIMKYEEVKWIMAFDAMIRNDFYNDNVKINIMTTYKDYKDRVIPSYKINIQITG